MASTYLALLIFLLFGAFLPISMILTSKLLRPERSDNSVKNANYESGEESVGGRISIMKEYLHYFSLFLAFDIITAIILIWAFAGNTIGGIPSGYILALAVLGFIGELSILALVRVR
jgi:NADH:ubiquinone oxidoreductase subunit 3 (subunit A)